MKTIYLFVLVCCLATANAAVLTIDFTSGVNTGNTSYTEDGFTLAITASGNHFDPGFIGTIGFHNGPGNPVIDNNLLLTFSGGAFDLTNIDFAGFENAGIALDLTGSDGSTATITSLGNNALPFVNVTSVTFSVRESSGNTGSAGWNSLLVNTVPTSAPVVPEPSSLALFGLCLVAFVTRKKLTK